MENKERIKSNIISFLIGSAVGALLFCLLFFLSSLTIKTALDSASVTFVILLGVSALCVVAYFGAFDTFAFGFKQLGTMLFNRKQVKKDTFVEYKENKKEKRKKSNLYFIGVLLSSAPFLIAMIVLKIIFEISLK